MHLNRTRVGDKGRCFQSDWTTLSGAPRTGRLVYRLCRRLGYVGDNDPSRSVGVYEVGVAIDRPKEGLENS